MPVTNHQSWKDLEQENQILSLKPSSQSLDTNQAHKFPFHVLRGENSWVFTESPSTAKAWEFLNSGLVEAAVAAGNEELPVPGVSLGMGLASPGAAACPGLLSLPSS